MPESSLVLVMGVSGSGKTTSAERWPVLFAGRSVTPTIFHGRERREDESGEPLDDRDRVPWLAAVRARIDEIRTSGQSVVLACSALKPAYREMLAWGARGVFVIHLFRLHRGHSPETARPYRTLRQRAVALEPARGAAAARERDHH